MSQVKTVYGISPNSLDWNLDPLKGEEFENIIFDIIKNYLSDSDGILSLRQTAVVNDSGRDIEIEVEAHKKIQIFGMSFTPKHSGPWKIFIEIKTKEQQNQTRLRINRFASNYLQNQNEDFDYFILVTNSSITPKAARQTTEAFHQLGKEFIVVDEALLRQFIHSCNLKEELTKSLITDYKAFDSTLVVEAQVERYTVNENLTMEIDLWFRNYTTKSLPLNIKIDNGDWRIDRSLYVERRVEPFCGEIIKIRAERLNTLSQELGVYFESNQNIEARIKFEADSLIFNFEPPIYGASHHNAINCLRTWIKSSDGLTLVSVTGEAGTGKTRVVTEVLKELGRLYKIVRVVFDHKNPAKSINELFHDLSRIVTSNCPQRTKKGASINEIVSLLISYDDMIHPLILFIEDVHHASEEICNELKKIMRIKDWKITSKVILITTGRNDFSFPNENYYSFLDMISFEKKEKPWIHSLEINPFENHDAKSLIKILIDDIPNYAVEKIHQTSGNTPFNILQCIEYMLETKIAILKASNCVGIPNTFSFANIDGFPPSMTEIFNARLKSLAVLKEGDKIIDYLLLASFYGQKIPIQLGEQVFDHQIEETAWEILFGRRILKRSETGILEWYHENLLHYYIDFIKQNNIEKKYACFLFKTQLLFNQFNTLEKGKIAAWAEEFSSAILYFKDVIAEIKKLKNFSSEHIDAKYYGYLDEVYISLKQTGKDVELCSKTLIAKAYLGTHNISGGAGVVDADQGLKKLSTLHMENDFRELQTARLMQLKAHALMDSGRIGQSKKMLLELESKLNLSPILFASDDLKFDLYNRLQDLYRFNNHLKLAENFGKLADSAASRCDKKLVAVGKLDSAIIYHYSDPAKCLKLHDRAIAYAERHGTERHCFHGEIGRYATLLSLHAEDIEKLRDFTTRIESILHKCIEKSYGGLIARCYLLLGNIYYLTAKGISKKLYVTLGIVDEGIDAATKYAAGYEIWQLYNLKAIIAVRNEKPIGEVEKLFNSAIRDLRASDLLSVGNADICFENLIVISNYIRFLKLHSASGKLNSFLSEINYYDNYVLNLENRFDEMVRSVLDYRILFQKKIPSAVIYDKETGYCLCTTC